MTEWFETATRECKSTFANTTRDKAHLAKEIVAFANADGGDLIFGAASDGEVHGVSPEQAQLLDAARVGDYLRRYIGDQDVHLIVRPVDVEGATVVTISVERAARPPIVMTRAGTCSEEGRTETLFDIGAVLVRSDTQARPARAADFQRWIAEAEDRGEQRSLEALLQFRHRPRGTVLTFSVPDTAQGRLQDAADAFEDNPLQLLNANQLLQLAAEARTLDVSEEPARRVLFHSALRKRTTLWLWVLRLDPNSEWCEEQLRQVLHARDRDVSDSGPGILEVAALLCPNSFADLHAEAPRVWWRLSCAPCSARSARLISSSGLVPEFVLDRGQHPER